MVEPAEQPESGRTLLRVLLVEDSEDDALLLLRELRRGGYEPEYERVETPEAMQKELAGSAWDVIVSDYHMPRFGATEAATCKHRCTGKPSSGKTSTTARSPRREYPVY